MLSSQQLSWETFLKAMNEGDPEILMVPSISDRSGTQNMVFRFWNFGKELNKSFPFFLLYMMRFLLVLIRTTHLENTKRRNSIVLFPLSNSGQLKINFGFF